jgi:hypothetical protein
MNPKPCPSCGGPKDRPKYMCGICWRELPRPARQLLIERGPHALRRLSELLEQLRNGVPLAEVVIAP